MGSEIYPKHGIEGFYLNELFVLAGTDDIHAPIYKWVVPLS
jgi:hypothetical protein